MSPTPMFIGRNEKELGPFRSPLKRSIPPNPLVGWVNRQTQRRRMTCGAQSVEKERLERGFF